jgi:hypothetical protein
MKKISKALQLQQLFDEMSMNGDNPVSFKHRSSAFIIVCQSLSINVGDFQYFQSGTVFQFPDGSQLKVEIEPDYEYMRVTEVKNED